MNDPKRQAKLRTALPELRTQYKAMAKAIDKAGHLILEMMRHPEATQQHILNAQASYARSYASFIQLQESLRKLYPEGSRMSGVYTTHPWSNK